MLLYVDKKGPSITANPWWYILVISTGKDREGSKDKRNSKCVSGAHDNTNDKMYIHCYRKKTGKQFIDFLKRVDRSYDRDIQNIFVVLDNLSVHKSKTVDEKISKYCPRIKFVFLPIRLPDLNLIEVGWS